MLPVLLLISECAVMYLSLYAIFEAKRFKYIPLEEGAAQELNELKEKTGATNTDMISYMVSLAKKDLAQRQIMAMQARQK